MQLREGTLLPDSASYPPTWGSITHGNAQCYWPQNESCDDGRVPLTWPVHAHQITAKPIFPGEQVQTEVSCLLAILLITSQADALHNV
jgi:hypothetical protein